MSRRPVVVLGAGAAGLCAAWELVRRGREVIVLEAEGSPGGLCRTVERDGYRFDLGGHRFLSRDRKLVADVRELLGGDLLESSRRSVILLGGRTYAYPLELLDLLRNLDPRLAIRGLWSYLRKSGAARLEGGDPSFRDWTVSRYGEVFYDLFFGPYTEKLWGIPAAELASDWASQRISLLDLSDVALRLLGLRRSETRTYARRYYYPRRGIGQIFSALAEEVRSLGGEIRTSTRVVGLTTASGLIRSVLVEGGGGHEAIHCDAVVNTLPLPDLARLLAPRDPGVAVAAGKLGFRGIRFLNLLLDCAEVTPNTWMYVPDPRCLFTRIQEPRQRSPESAPPGKTSLMLEIPCEVGGPTWEESDACLLQRCLADLRLLGMDLGSSLRGFFSTRVRHGYPLFRLGYQAHRDRLLAAAAAFRNLLTCGRQGTYRYIFMDTAMQMGIEAGRQVAEQQRETSRIFFLHSEAALLETRAITA